MQVEDISALDVETAPTVKTDNPYALEPWRCSQGKAEITCLTVVNKSIKTITKDQKATDIVPTLIELSNEYVVCHNALFDVAWLFAEVCKLKPEQDAYDIIRSIKWLDTMLLSRWLSNSQHAEMIKLSHSLIECCNRHLRGDPRLERFNDIKNMNIKPGDNIEYWLERNVFDTQMTLDLFKAMWAKLPEEQRQGYLIEQQCIAPIARGWVHGIPFDLEFAKDLHKKLESKKVELCKSLGVPTTVLTSPKQKQNLIYNRWGIRPTKRTPSGAPSTAHEVLMRLHQDLNDPRFDKLMAAIKIATIQNKYTSGFVRSAEYVGENKLYGAPRIFGTYTGRMTYSNKTTKKQIHQCSIALHQVPRKAKSIKHCMKIPEGYSLLAIDANSQELRWVAEKSGDEKLLQGYQKGLDLHSDMTSSIYGRPYEEVVKGNKDDIKEIVEERQSGKLLNLSCQYRIGPPALAEKFFTNYEKNIDIGTARRYLSLYKRQYPGVVRYWDTAIENARSKGYAETVGGRRFKISKFDWSGESSAINFPIQGSGADHTYATINLMNDMFPWAILVLQLHDGLYYFCPKEKTEYTLKSMCQITNTDVYEHIFNKPLPIKFPFDGGYSDDSFGKITQI